MGRTVQGWRPRTGNSRAIAMKSPSCSESWVPTTGSRFFIASARRTRQPRVPDVLCGAAVKVIVSIRAPARGATLSHLEQADSPEFQSAPPHGGRHGSSGNRSLVSRMFQSAPPHGGRLPQVRPGRRAELVSIRAPARGATQREALRVRRVFVSIRAPARGATWLPPLRQSLRSCFNPRPRTGGDPSHTSLGTPGEKFQSAPPHGGRHIVSQPISLDSRVSIRAPARGATRRDDGGGCRYRVSIRAPARGATLSR